MTINFLGQTSYIRDTGAKKPKIELIVNNPKKVKPKRQFKTYNLKEDSAAYIHPYEIYDDLKFIDLNAPEPYQKPRIKSKTRRQARELERIRKAKLQASVSIMALLTASAAALYAVNSSDAGATNIEAPYLEREQIYENNFDIENLPVTESYEKPEQIYCTEPYVEENQLETLYNGAFNFELTPTEENLRGVRKFMDIWNNPDNRARYEYVASQLDIPAEIVAINHYREATGDFGRSQTDGYPLEEDGFATWEESAIYAYTHRGIDTGMIDKDDINTWFEFFEAYNGSGYKNAGINTPYVWSGTNLYTSGKYVSNGKYDESIVDEQAGAALILRELFVGDVLKNWN